MNEIESTATHFLKLSYSLVVLPLELCQCESEMMFHAHLKDLLFSFLSIEILSMKIENILLFSMESNYHTSTILHGLREQTTNKNPPPTTKTKRTFLALSHPYSHRKVRVVGNRIRITLQEFKELQSSGNFTYCINNLFVDFV